MIDACHVSLGSPSRLITHARDRIKTVWCMARTDAINVSKGIGLMRAVSANMLMNTVGISARGAAALTAIDCIS